MDIFTEFQIAIGYNFKNEELLKQALTHSSFSHEMKINIRPHNERLEFLGDAVLELIVSEFLYKSYGNVSEGELSKIRASLVCEQTLASCAREISLGKYLQLGKGEVTSGGNERDSILSDAFEAVIGALYLDGEKEAASAFIMKFLLNDIEKHRTFYDSKSMLQELVQERYNEPLSYRLISESGPDHDKCYTSAAVLGGNILAQGVGKTKKSAEQKAAYSAILMLKEKEGN